MISRERLYVANKKARRRVALMADNFDVFYSWPEGERITGREWKEKTYVSYRKTTKRCSRACCGNPRKFFGELTMQEKRSAEIYRQWLKGCD
jgi:hypothetical protein